MKRSPAVRRRAASIAAVAVLVVALLTGCVGAGGDPPLRAAPADSIPARRDTSPAPSNPAPSNPAPSNPAPSNPAPAETGPCTVTTSLGERVLSRDTARELTSLAAAAQREGTAETGVAQAYKRLIGTRPGAGSPPSAAAAAVAEALSGSVPAALTCLVTRGDHPTESLAASGLTPRADDLRQRVVAEFGALPMGGFAPGGVHNGHIDDSSHYDGRAIDIFFRPVSAENTVRGWVLAHWLVAHGEDTTLLSVIYSDRIWTSWASCVGWRDYVHPNGPTSNAVLRHLDHVHTAVQGPRRVLSPEELAERAARGPICPSPTPAPAPAAG